MIAADSRLIGRKCRKSRCVQRYLASRPTIQQLIEALDQDNGLVDRYAIGNTDHAVVRMQDKDTDRGCKKARYYVALAHSLECQRMGVWCQKSFRPGDLSD